MSHKGGKYCCAQGCSSCKWKDNSTSFFRFPRDYARRQIWYKSANREDLLTNSRPDNYRLCSLHFEDSAFSNSERKRLLWNSTPTIFQTGDEAAPSAVSYEVNMLPETIGPKNLKVLDSKILQPTETGNVLVDADQICRLCAEVSIDKISLFSEEGIQLDLVKKIHLHLPIEVKPDDSLPLQVCTICVDKLEICHELVCCSLKSQTVLEELLELTSHCKNHRLVSTQQDNNLEPTSINEPQADVRPEAEAGPSSQHVLLETILNPEEEIVVADSQYETYSQPKQTCSNLAQLLSNLSSNMENTPIIDTEDLISGSSEVTNGRMHLEIFCVSEDAPIAQRQSPIEIQNPQNVSSRHDSIFGINCNNCWLCSEKFTNRDDMVDHQLGVHFESVFCCSECDIVIYEKSSYEDHLMLHYVIAASENHVPKIIGQEDYENKPTNKDTNSINALGKDCLMLPVLNDLQFENCAISEENGVANILQNTCSKRNELEVDLTDEYIENTEEVMTEDLTSSVALESSTNFNSKHYVEDIHNYSAVERSENDLSYECRVCSLLFSTESDLKNHIVSHRLDIHQCQYCDKVVSTKYKLIDHERVHTKEKPFSCEHCSKCFRVKQALKVHLRNHDETLKPFVCTVSVLDVVCGKRFGTKFGLHEHSSVHNSVPSFPCDQCQKVFKHKTSLLYHQKRHTNTADKNTHVCKFCETSFTDGNSLAAHIRAHTNEKLHKCETCLKQFRLPTQLSIHRKTHSSEQKYSCDVCDKRFKRRNNMICHLKRHSRTHRYTCAVCNYPSDNFRDLGIHRKTHSQEELNKKKRPPLKSDPGRFKCAECGKLLSTKVTLQRHMTLHTGVKPYECDLCEKSFTKKSDLTNHRVIHSGMKPFPCQFCEEGFMNRQACDVHERSHTGMTPFKCKFCTKEFRSKMNLNAHSAVHSDLRPFACEFCNRGFRRRDTLNAHVRTHTGERPFQCSTCERSFTQRGDCRMHERRAHGVRSCLTDGCSAYSCLLCGAVVNNDVDLTLHYEVNHFEQLAESDALEMMVIGVENSNSLPELTVCNREDLGLGTF